MNEALLTKFNSFTREELVEYKRKLTNQLMNAVHIEEMDIVLSELEVIEFLLDSDRNE